MNNLWAPWRMQFIEDLKNRKGGCIFCELAMPGDDRERLILHRGEKAFVVMNRFPYNNGHVLITPYRHVAALKDLEGGERQEMMKLGGEAVEIMSKTIEAEGFNCGINLGRAGGAGVLDHVHLHVVPRWVGDTNFLPVMSETRSMPEYLLNTYDRLVGGFKKIK
jgi:ATP adenylyltransferase